MKNKHGAIMILWAAALLGMPGCDDGEGDGSGTTGTTGMETTSTSTTDGGSDDTTGAPTPIPPVTPADTGSSTDDGTEDDDSSSGEPAELSCEAYCDIYADACMDNNEYDDNENCLNHCAQWPVGSEEDVEGDSLGCRTYHVTVASTTDPEIHCPHSGPSGDGVCLADGAPDCDLYCTRYFNNCTDKLNLWMDMMECMDTCAGWYPGDATDTEGHSIGCRAYYANLAAGNPEMHCPNAGPGGGDACVLPGG